MERQRHFNKSGVRKSETMHRALGGFMELGDKTRGFSCEGSVEQAAGKNTKVSLLLCTAVLCRGFAAELISQGF